eukprot:jgi/Ulvmu1/6999/UM033_0057.1
MGKNAAYLAQKAALGARSDEPPPPGTATGEDGVDASFHTKEWLEARFSAAAVKRETFEEYRERKDREDAQEQAQAQKLEDAEAKYREQMAKERKRRFASVDDAGVQKKESKHKSKSKKDKKDKKHKSSKDKSKKRHRDRSPR